MATVLDQIHQGDCVKGMEKLAEGSVDLVFADPPFNIGYEYDEYDDSRGGNEYLEWSRQWISAVHRVLKPSGAFWLAIGDEYAAELKVLCTRELGFHCRSWVIWYYTFGVHCTSKFTRSHAHIFHFVKNPKEYTFNSMAIRVPSARQIVYGDKRADPDGRVPDDTWMMAPVLPPDVPTWDGFVLRPQDLPNRFPPHSDTWFFSRVAGTFAERRGWHGCQMPEQLLGRIIRACSNPGETVLDPFGGSGTTPAVAKKLERRYIAFEMSKKYAKKIHERLCSIEAGDSLVGPENPELSAPRTRGVKTQARNSKIRRTRRGFSDNGNGQVQLFHSDRPGPPESEIAPLIREAFVKASDGYSTDRVIADPSLNSAFVDECRHLGVTLPAVACNKWLMNLRKSTKLMLPRPRQASVSAKVLEPFAFASEAAWQVLEMESGTTLDHILCDPKLASQFDEIAQRFSPGFSSFDYRWAALRIQKLESDRRRTGKLMRIPASAMQIISEDPLEFGRSVKLKSVPGVYSISYLDELLYLGITTNLRLRLSTHGECQDAFGLALNRRGFVAGNLRFGYDECAVSNTTGLIWGGARLEKIGISPPLNVKITTQIAA